MRGDVIILWCGVAWCGVVWRGVVWRGVAWCGVVWRGVVWCGGDLICVSHSSFLRDELPRFDFIATSRSCSTEPRPKPAVTLTQATCIDLEAPYCIHPSASTFAALGQVLQLVLPFAATSTSTPTSAAVPASAATSAVLSLLALLRGNFMRLQYAHVDPRDVGIVVSGATPTLQALHRVLMTVSAACHIMPCRVVPCRFVSFDVVFLSN